MDKIKQLEKVKKQLESKKDLPFVSSGNDAVFSDGNPDSDIMFIGEAAGYHESVQHKPFVGQAGKLLNRTLEEIGIKREDVYITNVIKARPPNNRDPLPEEIGAFKEFLDREIEIVDPPVIVTLGRFSMNKFLPGVKISQVHGKPTLIDWRSKKIAIVPMYHPAAALRASAILSQFKQDFKIIPRVVVRAKAVREKEKEDKKPNPSQIGLIEDE